MFDLHHILAAIGVAVAGLALVLGRRASKAPPAAPGSATGASSAADGPAAASAVPQTAPDGLTARAAAELVGHEAIVLEAYRDSKHIWTWGIGVTDASGHTVERYIDHPQPIAHCLEIFVWLLRTKYLPDVIRAFRGTPLSEAQLAAALSFHYNTGAIGHARWVALWISGDAVESRTAFMEWRSPPSIIDRREKERDLFFNATWSGDGNATVYSVLKPSYQPDFSHPTRIPVLAPLQALLGA